MEEVEWRKLKWLQTPGLKEIDKQLLNKLKQSLIKNNFIQAFNIWKEQNNIWILDGHHRKMAMEELENEGYIIPNKLPAIFIDCKNKQEAAKYVLLYTSQYARILEDGLKNFLIEFNIFDKESLSEIDLPNIELNKLFMEQINEEKLDEIPEKPITTEIKYGDIFLLNNKHRLMCGDSTKEDDIKKLINQEKIKLCFTSPPYNMNSNLYENYIDNLKSEEFINLHLNVIYAIKPFLSGFIFWNINYNKNARWEFIEIIYRIIKEIGLKFLELIIWDKGHGLPITSQQALTRQIEFILLVGDEDNIQQDLEIFFIGTTEKKAFFNKKTQRGITNYWKIGTNKTQIENLKACYPVALPQKGIELMTQEEDCIIDPFGGSGTTLIASEILNRKCYMMEIDPLYVDIILKRYYKLFPNHSIKCLNRNLDIRRILKNAN